MAHFEKWHDLKFNQDTELYKNEKENLAIKDLNLLKKIFEIQNENLNYTFKDVFSPTTITRYTSHFGGTVYGSTTKSRDGTTPFKNLFIIGTDQGFLGIVGSMLSGISLVNKYTFGTETGA